MVHIPPSRADAIALLRQIGTRAFCGEHWALSEDETIAMWSYMTDAEWLVESTRCNHYDNHGHCLGHPDEARA